MKSYLDLKIEGKHSSDNPDEEGAFARWSDLTDNFFIFLENNPTILDVTIKRLIGALEDARFTVKGIKIDNDNGIYKIVESNLADLDLVFGIVIKFLKYRNRDGAVKCFYIKDMVWSHIFHPTAFCPIPGIIMRFFEVRE